MHGTLIAQNDRDTWTLHTRYPANEADAARPEALVARFVGRDIPMQVQVANRWSPHLAVARSAGTARVLLAGDAGHQYIPTGGYGMNTGVADAFGLGWMLAAVLKGFGGPGLIEAYKAERLPVWERSLAASRRHNEVRVEIAGLYGAPLLDGGAEGEAARAHAAARIAAIGNAENESLGIELGAHYVGSPVIADEGSATPPQDPLRYEPTTLPGGRLPSLYLQDGRAVFDLLGAWFTLIAHVGADTDELERAAAVRGVPLQVLRHDDARACQIYDADLLLVRPDQHIAWRANRLRKDAAESVIARALGWPV